MKRPPQSLHDKVLWELASHEGKMKRSDLRQRLGMKLSELEPILQELDKEGKIGISGQLIFLKSR